MSKHITRWTIESKISRTERDLKVNSRYYMYDDTVLERIILLANFSHKHRVILFSAIQVLK